MHYRETAEALEKIVNTEDDGVIDQYEVLYHETEGALEKILNLLPPTVFARYRDAVAKAIDEAVDDARVNGSNGSGLGESNG